ncbi:hypothetical protein TTHERM_000395949 (macronuclear) [Tetrahymena thermophila SB210]|uniref:Uncharacterized protein n=1 Tax=Tetrahymena thermophila (strain SB210) TaxID=312017 RepID=W7XF76_TETTS|nr:hypothetical protein TTHERM_000395949 [Tetrahymena thermophila SB210]EWS75473.1 hypothetical protein TTHERM_000395949 [Tetrahymena thermophila SB210]|eukprot:XP_012651942.1 hypothetical protein TTHERM_000395949 [Tetrahymena thermophila SB210]
MANSSINNSMFDYFESYMRKKHKKRYTPDLREYSSKKTLIEDSIEEAQQEINDENRKGQIQKKGFQTPRNNELIDTNNRILQSKIMLTGQKKVAKHILNSNTESSPKKEEGQKEIFQNLRECFSFIPQQNLVQDKKLNHINIKRKDEDDKKEKHFNLPPITQHYIDTQNPIFNYQSFHYNQLSLLSSNSNDKKISFKTTRKNTMLKRFDEKPVCNMNQKNNIQIKIGEVNLQAKKCYTDFDSIKLDSVNIMNNSSFKSYDFQEVQKQAIIQQAEKQQQKEIRKINNLNRGLDRLNFQKGRQKIQPSPQEPFIGLVFQDYENYTPIHSSNYRRSPLIPDQEQNQSFELPLQSIADSSHHTITNKKLKSNKINHSFF